MIRSYKCDTWGGGGSTKCHINTSLFKTLIFHDVERKIHICDQNKAIRDTILLIHNTV